jgi:hypothetical protein
LAGATYLDVAEEFSIDLLVFPEAEALAGGRVFWFMLYGMCMKMYYGELHTEPFVWLDRDCHETADVQILHNPVRLGVKWISVSGLARRQRLLVPLADHSCCDACQVVGFGHKICWVIEGWTFAYGLHNLHPLVTKSKKWLTANFELRDAEECRSQRTGGHPASGVLSRSSMG